MGQRYGGWRPGLTEASGVERVCKLWLLNQSGSYFRVYIQAVPA